ncbi:AAA family ATPase [Salinadaptatus halalkaliphilus]|uniref:AAA family ATPase n=1 Tax=Salinadaptatus halalkaliphilus TaxID=2419781 RepID=A0A4V3VLF2_9EURY|nr:AAA family ATPase [Salinadaptatus halalkaliphilus]THE65187.1 AAA family ATPase [Salinadaptatus halalkaliphilus]
MNVRDRIARRQSAHQHGGIVVDREQLSPVVHRQDPIGRDSIFEQLLDALEAVFDGGLPEPVTVVGPAGSGTSAIVTALFDALNDRFGAPSRSIGTTTRAGRTEPVTWFVTVDGRRVESAFAFYRAVLSVLSTDPVPESGIGTGDLETRLASRLERHGRRAVVAIDHHDEPETLGYDRVCDLLEPVGDSVSTVAVGRGEPDDWSGTTVRVPAYREHELVDVLTDRVSTGLAAGTVEHETIRELAMWAEGNAHDALAALFTAAVSADAGGADRIDESHVDQAVAAVPDDGVHVARPLALPETRQQVLGKLVAIERADRPIREVADEIADRSSLTTGTVTRFLYELADRGILERVTLQQTGNGRRPSTVEARFPSVVFRSLSSAVDTEPSP